VWYISDVIFITAKTDRVVNNTYNYILFNYSLHSVQYSPSSAASSIPPAESFLLAYKASYSSFCSLTSILYSLLSPLHPRLSSCAAIQSHPLQPPLSSLGVSSIFPFSLICLQSCPAASSILPCCVICPCLKHPLSHPEASFILCLLPLQPGIS
jgi:hypothetical protein